jgi:hypothetical protein
MVDRLDEERIEILRSWGLGLASDDREELRAAGKAITVLIEEIDLLQVDLWNARVVELEAAEPEPLVATRLGPTQGTALRDRLARIRPQS